MEGPNSRRLGSTLTSASPPDPASNKITLVLEARILDRIPENAILDGVIMKETERWVKRELVDLNKALICIIDTDILPLMDSKIGTSHELLQSLIVASITDNNDKCLESVTVADAEEVEIIPYKMWGLPAASSTEVVELEESLPRGDMVNPAILAADVFRMPCDSFKDQWEELVFEQDHKEEIFWMVHNMLTFAADMPDEKRKMSPMALFHGPPGTGKTSLCQAMAQKLSVRLSSIYPNTTMVQIKTATLLSKYYSESAKQVDALFTKIKLMCENDTKRIIFVLIDEVESIAGSRHKGIADGESQDSLRATNALITGFDRVKRCPNIVFLCTSNMVEYLDRAFVDRCSVQIEFTQPSKECQYKILRTCILSLIARKIIGVDDKDDGNARGTRIESYNFSRLFEAGTTSPSGKLYKIVESLHSEDAKERFGNTISGRFLSQLPMQVLMKYTRPKKSIQLDHALDLIGKELGEMSKRNHKRKWEPHTKQTETSEHFCCAKELMERLVESKLLPPSPPTPVKKIFHGYPKGGYNFSPVKAAAYDFATDYDDPNHAENDTHRDEEMAQRSELMTSRCSSEENRQESASLEFDDEDDGVTQVQKED